MNLYELEALLPDAAVEANRLGELVIYTGLRVNVHDEEGPLIPFECPSCNSENQDEQLLGCEDTWHGRLSD